VDFNLIRVWFRTAFTPATNYTTPFPPPTASLCPHCRHELAVIAVVIPADAAHIPTPEVIT